MKRKLLLLFFLSVLNSQVNSQSLGWAWAKKASGLNLEYSYKICSDKDGNVFITGNYNSLSCVFDSITINGTGSKDVFLAKYDSNGNILWVRRAGRALDDEGRAICADASGNIYLTGLFRCDTLSFDTFNLVNHHVGYMDIFIVKYNPSGNVIWAKCFGGSSFDETCGIDVDRNNNIVLSGRFTSPTITFDSITLSLINFGSLFIAKLDSLGNVLWAKSAGGGVNNCFAKTDKNGNVYATGEFGSNTVFGNDTLVLNGASNIFFAKYDSSGNFVWAHSYGCGSLSNNSAAINIDTTGNIYITGLFGCSSMAFDTVTIINSGYYDVYLVKFNSSGHALWAKDIGSYTTDDAGGVVTDKINNVYVTGSFSDSAIILNSDTLHNAGSLDGFIAKYDEVGNLVWAKQFGGSGYESSYDIALDSSNNIFVTGIFGTFVPFDNTILNCSGQNDIYVAKLASCIVPTTQSSNISFSNITSNSMTVSWTSGNGTHRIVKIKKTNTFTDPVDGLDYIADSVYAGGEQVIYNGTGNSVNVTGLATHTFYWFRVYEACCSSNNALYLTVSATGNPIRKKTLHASPNMNPNRPESAPEIPLSNSLLLYPNPTTDNITLETSEDNPIQSITVYSADGRMVRYVVSGKGSAVNVDMHGFSAGIYFLDCIMTNGSEKVKVVKY